MSRNLTQPAQAIEAKPVASEPRADHRDVAWPADRFLWAVLDAPSKAGPLAPSLLPQLAEQVHVEPDDLAAVAAPLDESRTLVCALERDRFNDLPEGALRLTPASLPECLAEAPPAARPDPARLDLLVGTQRPAACRRRARLRSVLAAAGVGVASVLAALGLWRRAGVWDRTARQAHARASEIVASIDPLATLADLPLLAGDAERTRRSVAALDIPEPIAPVLADVLAHWPATSPPATISVQPRAILATVLVEGDPGAFLAAIKPPPGFRLQEPRLGSMAGGTHVTLVMDRAGTGGAP